MNRPAYSYAPVQSIQSLCRALAVPEPMLLSTARRAGHLYIGPKRKVKKDGSTRFVYDTKPPLKPLLKRINNVFFRRVFYPKYLTGSLAGRDFIANVDIHKGGQRVITEDIAKFFDYITAEHVHHIWRNFFRFSEDVAQVLTVLTTKDGRVFQGTPTSSYLANLAFWDREPALVQRLRDRSIRYSRYVDDITMSSLHVMGAENVQWAIAQAYGMIGSAGFKPKRAKHGSYTASVPITLMGLNANSNKRPTLTSSERARIRAQVFQLERRLSAGEKGAELDKALNLASGKVGRLKRLHEREAGALRARVDAMRVTINTRG